jgi:hypothetical protein
VSDGELQHVSGEELIRKMFLNLPREKQLDTLREVYREHGFGPFMALTKVALDAPCNAGGIPTEILDKLHTELLEEEDKVKSSVLEEKS